VLVFDSYKSWQVSDIVKGKPVYRETLDYKGNEDLPINEENEAGVEVVHRDKVLGFYCLLLSEVVAGDAFPYIVDFKRTSRRAGQTLVSKFAKLRSANLPSYAKVFSLGAKQESNDHGTYYVKTVSTGRDIEQDEVAAVERWLVSMREAKQRGTVRVDDTDLKQTKTVEAEVTSNSQY